MAKASETVTGRWPVAVYGADRKRVAPGEPATVTKEKATEFDRRFGRLPDDAPKAASPVAAPKAD
ncbi:hypothetical protein [Nitratireductor luteus]|uniref:hypothetical protein n=1 Tax=Nitratireductor luteus TaxID=2976980 RepID=UPI00223EC623|nr:hypothetical protein [Nitratireductor luteus]